MSLYDWLLFLHIATAFALVSALVLFTYLILGGRSLDVPSDIVRMFRISKVGDALMGIGSIGVLVFGIWLAIDSDVYELWDAWVIIAIVLWLGFGAVGSRIGKIYYAARDRAKALVAEGRDAPNPELNAMLRSQTGLVLHFVTVALAILLLIDMIYKPGAYVDTALLLHVFGAMILVGGLVTSMCALALGWKSSAPADAFGLGRVGFRALLYAAVPGWILMRIGAIWVYEEAGFSGDNDPAWLGVGFITAELGGALLLIAAILSGVGVRRLRASGAATSTLIRVSTVLVAVLLAAYIIAVWAMSAKPT